MAVGTVARRRSPMLRRGRTPGPRPRFPSRMAAAGENETFLCVQPLGLLPVGYPPSPFARSHACPQNVKAGHCPRRPSRSAACERAKVRGWPTGNKPSGCAETSRSHRPPPARWDPRAWPWGSATAEASAASASELPRRRVI